MENKATAIGGGKRHHHTMDFGPLLLPGGGVLFRLWAPGASRVELRLEDDPAKPRHLPMESLPGGWFRCAFPDAGPGTLYRFRIDGDLLAPDPASRFQPCDVHGPSRVVDPGAFDWGDTPWPGRPWEETILYELHVGAFSPEGTFAGVEARLDDLVDLGITAIELMPLADFPGARNWGYDGALLFAPDSVYGTPDDLRRLVKSAHGKGLMVFLDVVYNHFGPEGNYLYAYAQEAFFHRDKTTPWGAAINFTGPAGRTVRDFFIANTLYWLEEFQLDGLRFDAVHGIDGEARPLLLGEMAAAVARGPGKSRRIHLILENDDNESRYLRPQDPGGAAPYRAQWNDDIHHALHHLLTGEASGYYRDYADDPLRHLGRCLTQGFAYQGDPSPFRNGHCRGEPSTMLPPTSLVAFLQNHDQVGNRPFGDRLAALAPEPRLRLAVPLILLSPQVPLLFMGEEFFAETPFFFFCDFEGELAAAVCEGRRQGFVRLPSFAGPARLAEIPDPNAPASFLRSRLDWRQRLRPQGKRCYDRYRNLLALRKKYLIPRLSGMKSETAHFQEHGPEAFTVHWRLGDGAGLSHMVNFSNQPISGMIRPDGMLIYGDPAEIPGGAGAEVLLPGPAIFIFFQPAL